MGDLAFFPERRRNVRSKHETRSDREPENRLTNSLPAFCARLTIGAWPAAKISAVNSSPRVAIARSTGAPSETPANEWRDEASPGVRTKLCDRIGALLVIGGALLMLLAAADGLSGKELGEDDVVAASSRGEVLRGFGGDDELRGGPGRDRLIAGGGSDLVEARDGRVDLVECGDGAADVVRADGRDRVTRDCETVFRP